MRAVFGEQYPDPVRVVAIGGSSVQDMLDQPKDDKWQPYSVEFCGGTHISNSKEAELFALLNEEVSCRSRSTLLFLALAGNSRIFSGRAIATGPSATLSGKGC